MKYIKIITIIVSSMYMVGCGYVTSNYGASPDNVDDIRAAGDIKVSVNDFTSITGQERVSIGCRAAGPVGNPSEQSFEDYIHDAFVNELRMAGAYAEDAEVSISGEIKELDFNSNIGSGKWVISAKVASSVSDAYSGPS
jgi:hypothetical protein